MNIQAMMKQAQKLQKEMMDEKEKIDAMEFETTTSFVTVKMKGTKEIISIKIDQSELKEDEIEMVEDMIMVATNECLKKVNTETEQRLGKYTQGMPGLF